MNPLRLARELIRYRPGRWSVAFVMWTIIHAMPILLGLLVGAVFDGLMFATDAQLFVFDDLSSALDVHTEALMWERLFRRRHATCLVVSHRRTLLERADRIVLLSGGRIAGEGTLDDLLSCSELMRDLWETSG